MPMSSGLRYGPHRGLLFLKSNLSPSNRHVGSRSRLQWYPISKIQEPTIAFNAKYEIGLGYLDFCQLNSNYLLWESNCLRYRRVIGAGRERGGEWGWLQKLRFQLFSLVWEKFRWCPLVRPLYQCKCVLHCISPTNCLKKKVKMPNLVIFIQLQDHWTFKVSIVSRAGQRDQIDNFGQLYWHY